MQNVLGYQRCTSHQNKEPHRRPRPRLVLHNDSGVPRGFYEVFLDGTLVGAGELLGVAKDSHIL
jgi:hypothetical protein